MAIPTMALSSLKLSTEISRNNIFLCIFVVLELIDCMKKEIMAN